MQISIKWHSEKFVSIESMLNPYENINYAAEFLLELKKIHGTWEQAIKHYHSSTSKLNKKYYTKVESFWKKNVNNAIFNTNAIHNQKETNLLFLEKNVFYSEKSHIINKKVNLSSNSNLESEKGENYISKKNINRKIDIDFKLNDKSKFNNSFGINNIKSSYLKRHYDKILFFRKQFELD